MCAGRGVRTSEAWQGPGESHPIIFQISLTTWDAAGLYGTLVQSRKKGSLWMDKLAKSALPGCHSSTGTQASSHRAPPAAPHVNP